VGKLNMGAMLGGCWSGTARNSGSPAALQLQSGRRSGPAGRPEQDGLQPRLGAPAGSGSIAPRRNLIGSILGSCLPGTARKNSGSPETLQGGGPSGHAGHPAQDRLDETTVYHLPEPLLAEVVARCAETGLDQQAARRFAAIAQVNHAFAGASKAALNMQPGVGRAASAARLARAVQDAIQDLRNVPIDTPHAQKLDQARHHVAAALRDLEHVRVDFGSLRSSEVAAAVVDVLAGHAGLRSLEIAVPADFPALALLMDLLAARPGILRSLELRGTAGPTPAPVPDPATVARVLLAQKATLTRLNLSSTGLGLESLGGAIASLSGLKSLNLHGMPLGASQTHALAGALGPLQSLQDLDLSHCRLGVAACGHLVGVLENHPQLRRLNLGSNLLGDTGAQVLGLLLATLARLDSLDLSSNDIGLEGCRAVAAQLVWRVGRHKDAQATASLRHLSLAHNPLGDEAAGHLARAFEAIPWLHELDIGSCQIGPDGMGALGPALKQMTQLRILNLQRNHLDESGHSHLGGVLEHLPNLRELCLRDTLLNANGLAALEDPLAGLTQLNALDLAENPLRYEGCMALAPLLEKLPQLQTLKLAEITGTQIHWGGLNCLFSGLCRLRQLQHLDLGSNGSPEGEVPLADVISSLSGGLKTLNLESMVFQSKHWRPLASALKDCTELRELNLMWTDLTPNAVLHLTPAIAGLPHLEVLGLCVPFGTNEISLSKMLSGLGGARKLQSVTITACGRFKDPNALQDVLPHVPVHVSFY
jgi:Ran GTPase-activating protein (RanGAP) involved in mRNA processing and transport